MFARRTLWLATVSLTVCLVLETSATARQDKNKTELPPSPIKLLNADAKAETERRFTASLSRALSTAPKPQASIDPKKKKPSR